MLSAGIRGTKTVTVTEELTAARVGSGELPVYATPALIALAEECAWRSAADELEPGQGTVGTRMDLAHLAATPVGMKVTCETELTEIDRRRLVFRVTVFDEKERIAEGTHERFVVDNERFAAKAAAKLETDG